MNMRDSNIINSEHELPTFLALEQGSNFKGWVLTTECATSTSGTRPSPEVN